MLITGAARGIGAAVAARCAAEGARVALADLDRHQVQATALALRGEGRSAAAFPVDVADAAQVVGMVGAVRACFGRIDCLVNNAGVVEDAQLKNMQSDQWDRVIAVNLSGAYHCARSVIDTMLAQRAGSIVNIASVVGLYGNFGQSNYAAAKAGLIGMTRSWAKELGPKGIRANAICPGLVHSSTLTAMPEPMLEDILRRVPLGRLGTPGEVASLAAFLASDEASYMSGAVIEVAGGLTL